MQEQNAGKEGYVTSRARREDLALVSEHKAARVDLSQKSTQTSCISPIMKSGDIVRKMKRDMDISLRENAKKKVDKMMRKLQIHEYEEPGSSDHPSGKQEPPLARIELNVGNGRKETVLFREGDKPESLAEKVGAKYGMSDTRLRC